MPARPSTAPRRSDPTRARILDAARARFAREGYEMTTIRAVAADANIDPSMVMRYYGNKDGLFAAAADIDLNLPDLTAIAKRHWGRRIATHFFERWEGNSAQGTLGLLVRSAATNEHAADRLRDLVDRQITATLKAAGIDHARRRAALIATQMLGLAYCRYVLALPEIATVTPDNLIPALGSTIQRYITTDLGPRRTT
jgi:AcrR family transcriptional regulator